MLRRLIAFVAVGVLTACGSPPPPPQAPSGDPVRRFVEATYPHGVPYDQARALGAAAEPNLLLLLDQTSMTPHRGNILVTLGILGSTTAVQRVVTEIEKGTGQLTADEVNARMDGVLALGYAAYADTNRTTGSLTYVLEGTSLPRWNARVKWELNGGGDPARRLLARTIGALGLSGRREALRALEDLLSAAGGGRGGPPATPEHARIADALEANKYIAANGMTKYYEAYLR
jgi:hypothetical protein